MPTVPSERENLSPIDFILLYSIGISDKGLFWGRRPLTALNGHLMNLVGPFLALKKKKNVGLAS